MLEDIRLSLQSIWNHKLRSVLTMLGIIIGIAAIITIVSTIKGTNDQIKANLIGEGTNVVNVSIERTDGGYYDFAYSELPEGVKAPDASLLEALAEVEGVSAVSCYYKRDWVNNVYADGTTFNGSCYGIDARYLSTCGYKVDLGRGLTERDFKQHRKVVVLDQRAVSTLFAGQNPLGRTVDMNGEPFTIVGVVSKTKTATMTIRTPNDYWQYADTSSGMMFIPTAVWPVLYRYDEPLTFAIRAASTDEMTNVGIKTAQIINERLITNVSYQYKADDLLSQAEQLQQLSQTANAQLIWIAGISLLVGGIGVMNIMLVSVTERTREIGLKKAIGARRKRIVMQFLTEAGVLTSLGGIIGVLGGIGLSQMLSGILGMPVAVSVPACLIAVAFSMIIGILFGLLPAIKASKLNPIEALRRE